MQKIIIALVSYNMKNFLVICIFYLGISANKLELIFDDFLIQIKKVVMILDCHFAKEFRMFSVVIYLVNQMSMKVLNFV